MLGDLRKGWRTRRCAFVFNPVNLERLHDIFECDRPHSFQRFSDALLNLIEDLLRDANTAGSGQAFDASSDVNAIANYIVLGMDHVAQVDSDTHLETALRINGISLCDRLLNLNPAFHCR